MHRTMNAVRDTRNTAQAISPAISVAQPLDTRTADCASAAVQSAGSEPSRRRWRESVKAISPRIQVVRTAPAESAERHRVGEVGRPDPDWRPENVATRHLSDRAPFAAQLSGWDPDRVADADYPWSVP